MEKPQNGGARQPGARTLALSLAAAYLVVGGAAGALVLRAGAPSEQVDAGVHPSSPGIPPIATTVTVTTTTSAARATTPPSRSVPTTPSLPGGFRTVEAPGGLVAAVPQGWSFVAGSIATTLVGTDPADPRREVRFGGAPVEDTSATLLERITRAADERRGLPGHVRLALAGTTIREFPGVRWEFEYLQNGTPRRAAATYWEVSGTEYVVYAAGTPEQWPATRSLVDTMVAFSRP